MKKLYLIATADTIPRPALTKMLGNQPDCWNWFYSIPHSIFVFSSLTADDLYQRIKQHFPGDDRLFVTEVPSDNRQGWLPKSHWKIIEDNDVVHEYALDFDGYWTYGSEGFLPGFAGIYCVYSCTNNRPEKTVAIEKLLYIGQARNIRERLQSHDDFANWVSELGHGKTLCYSYAPLPWKSLDICEAALIFHMKPLFNKIGERGFHHDKTHVTTKGCNRFLESDFVVSRTLG